MNIFYIPEVEKDAVQIELPLEESKHACKVMRMKEGDQLTIMDGKGSHFLAEIQEANPKKCIVKVLEHSFEEGSSKEVHIAIAPTKNMDRLEWFVEKSTELGIDEISLLISKNSERTKVKMERLEKIVIAASKQSQRRYLPRLNPPIKMQDFVTHYKYGAIAHCYNGNKMHLKNNFQSTNYPILIGPEGDFTEKEVSFALKSGYDPVTLGKTRLRTETAGLLCCILAKTILER
ncbi:MAG: 16S rRNA (uracil(1498)-N(3))-methyltransferase [Bacteroidetes bacterium]|nr:MAG: 16S rRNA (uracil(1498)-N(3))-methyltransferase [Bacteroidota bacterium]